MQEISKTTLWIKICLDAEYDSQPMAPQKLYFGPTKYSKACKIITRCAVKSVLDVIGNLPEELEWFKSHPQFKHLFHMFKEPNHMNQGLWMLRLHTAYTEKQNEAWFVVNGVPIRYSLREHALLCVLDCHDYPADYKKLEKLKFVQKHFGRDDKIKIAEVEAKQEEMKETSLDRKKMALFLFLCKVLKAKSKADGNIDPFLLRAVGDLKLCRTFSWGHYMFDNAMKEI
ncbi:uncharacterized protein At3g43530-like [Eutrema salsugineum]|uniref:uncharacterized protein At3g43530-like n=1 Tax=Eutrema salsugineum TaxID=72664 RepID=UPI000CED371B|nr:uncharacterized protein At3g43530-like [Eutrema salsugineum]